MNEEGAVGAAPNSQGPDGAAGSSLPPIDDRRAKQMDKAAQRAAKDMEECQKFKVMTLDQKKKALDGYNPLAHYTKGSYVDAMDTTNAYMMAKITDVTAVDIDINYDGWSEKWDFVSLTSFTLFRSCLRTFSPIERTENRLRLFSALYILVLTESLIRLLFILL